MTLGLAKRMPLNGGCLQLLSDKFGNQTRSEPDQTGKLPLRNSILCVGTTFWSTFGSNIALSARMLDSSLASSPQCAFTLTKKVAVPTVIPSTAIEYQPKFF